MLMLNNYMNYKIIINKMSLMIFIMFFFKEYFLMSNMDKMNKMFNMDFISNMMTILLIWMMIMLNSMMFSSINKKYIVFNMMSMLSFMIFKSNNWIMFYISFELMFPMMMLVIFLWGKSQERFISSSYFFMYGMIGSLPMLMSFIYMLNFQNSNMMFIINNHSYLFYMCALFLMSGFFIKMAFYWFHYWLPKAHVESSTEGSMFLSSVMMKYGVYGILRFKKILMCMQNIIYLYMFIMFGMIYSVLMMIGMKDFKQMVAYSSISHISVLVIFMYNMKYNMFKMMIILSLSHGLISPFLFFFTNVLYNIFNSRNMNMFSSMFNNSLLYFILFSIIFMVNMGIPPTFNFFSEFVIFMNMIYLYNKLSFMIMINMIMFMLFFSKIIIFSAKKNQNMQMMNNYNNLLNIMFYILIIIMIMLNFYSLKLFL